MASSSSSLLSGSQYDVFLSFRGEDTRKGFVGHLYRALDQRGIRTFKDDKRLEQGKSISSDLVKNINESSIAVIVFSKNYANSSWCLEELVEILECRRIKGQIVLPIFYDVKASEVRKQKRSFAEAFKQHEEIHKEEMERVQKWRAALKEAANLSGFDLEDAANGYEDNFIQQIVQVISRKLQPKPFRVAEFEAGIDSRAKKVIMLLNERPEDKLFVGIYGIGGIGKTTVAKEVFNQIFKQFEGSCFLENVREETTKHGGLAKLQSDLLRETLMDDNIKISSPDRGINEIKDRLCNKRLLLVLDDVDKENTLKYLVGGHEWFGNGTRIILTTRDKRLLENYNVKTYNLELLNDSEALQIFSWYAFKKQQPEDNYEELAHRAKDYAKGLPLALKVFGSHLHKRRKPEWSSILDRLETNPSKEIHDVLRISYDGLDKEEKDIFLDIACFFKGYDKEYVINIYQRHEFDLVIGIQILSERCLIEISEQNELSMHDLVQEMGREIVRQESEDPGKRSRLWSYEDISEVFTQNTVTEKIEAIMLPNNGLSLEGVDFFKEGLHVRADAFTKMRKLRILKIDGVQLDGCLTYLSNELRYLDWNEYPEEYLPHNFHPKKLVQLHLHNSLIKGIWTNTNFSVKLKILHLSRCKHLKETPNLSMLPYLEMLGLEGCTNLVEVHPSIEFHERLVELSFENCENLKKLATRINFRSLRGLSLSGCSKFEEFPEISGDMECLTDLELDGTAIKELPPSVFKHFKGLKSLNLEKCKMLENLTCNIGERNSLQKFWLEGTAVQDLPLSVEQLKGLTILDLSYCKKLESLPSYVGEMKCLSELCLSGSGIKKLPSSVAQSTNLEMLEWCKCDLDEESILNLPHSLRELYLGRNNFVSLPASFTQLTSLTYLYLDGCLSLQTLDSLPSSIQDVTAIGCVSLERYWIPTSEGRFTYNRSFIFLECHKLVENDGKNKPNIYSYSESELLQEGGQIVVPGSEIPNWFSHIYEIESNSGEHVTSVCLRIDDPTNSLHYLTGFYVCVVIGIDHEVPSFDDHGKFNFYFWDINIKINGCREIDWDLNSHLTYIIRSDHIMLLRSKRNCISNGCDIEALFPTHLICNGRSFRVKKIGIHPLMGTKDEYDDEDEDEGVEYGDEEE